MCQPGFTTKLAGFELHIYAEASSLFKYSDYRGGCEVVSSKTQGPLLVDTLKGKEPW